MKLPVTYKTILRILITIAEHGNDYYGGNLTEDEQLQVGSLIADIQNDLGEMNETILAKLGLAYKG